MIGLDTNVVIRYLVQDDEAQAKKATQFIEQSLSTDSPGYINHIVLCEIGWVLERCYEVTKAQLKAIFEALLETKQFVVEDVEVVWKALRAFDANSADFSDALIGQRNMQSGCEQTATFDKKAAKLPGIVLLE